MLQVLIADDHPVVRQGVRSLLRETPGFAEPQEAATGAETLACVATLPLDVVVINTTLTDVHSLEILDDIKRLKPGLPVIMLHPDADPEFARLALARGADGIVTKLSAEAELLTAIRAVTAHETYVCSSIAPLMNTQTHNGHP